MSATHDYEVRVRWTGNTGTGTSGYGAYGRGHDVIVDGKPVIEGSADPAFRGDQGLVNPEELLVASLSQCHMLTYLAHCALGAVVVTAYEDRATGIMALGRGGRGGRFTEVTLRPVVTVAEASMVEAAMTLHDRAHEDCFVASSVNFPVRHVAHVDVAAGAC